MFSLHCALNCSVSVYCYVTLHTMQLLEIGKETSPMFIQKIYPDRKHGCPIRLWTVCANRFSSYMLKLPRSMLLGDMPCVASATA